MAERLRPPEEMAACLDAWPADAPEDAAGAIRALGDTAGAKGMMDPYAQGQVGLKGCRF